MAVTIISANLNTYGNAGHFETDPSTWGFASPLNKSMTRSGLQKNAGLYAALLRTTGANADAGIGVFCRFPVPNGSSLGKKFLVRAKVYMPSAAPFADDAETIGIGQVDSTYYAWDGTLEVTKTVLEGTDAWVEISGVVEVIQEFWLGYFTFGIEVSGTHIIDGEIFVDEFEVYQVEVTDDPEPTCTVDLDEDNTTVIDESAPSAGDGSIEGAATGGSGDYEYSLNGGAWQISPLFSGLSAGNYTLRVRDEAAPDCIDSHVFAVNDAAVGFDFTIDITNETISGASDGAAVLTPSGTGGPFTYSNDGGDTFQGSNNFPNLPAGAYAFVVKDSSGNTVVKYATVAAGLILFEKAFFSRNPIPYSVNAQGGYGALTNYRIYCDTRVEEVAGSGIFTSKLAQELPANSQGKAVFSLRPAFRNEVVAIVPEEPTSSMTKLTDRIKWFKNYVGHLQDDETPAILDEEDLTVSNPFLVLLGGVSKYHYPTINYLSSYLQTNKKFLTWAPVVKEVGRQQEDYLNFFIYSATITMLKLQLKVYFDDGTDETDEVATIACQYGELYQIPAGTSNTPVFTVNPAKTAIRYEIFLNDQADSLISEVRTYTIDRVAHPHTRYLMILNSLGAFEVHRFKGQTRAEEQYTREVVQKFLPHDYDQLAGELEINDVYGQRVHSFSSGYLKGPYADQWLDYMRDLMRATRFYDVTTGERLPMLLTSTSLQLKEDQNFRRFVRFEAREVYSNENYTPDEV